MLDLIEEGELTSEIKQANAFKEGVYTAMIKIDKCVKSTGESATECGSETHATIVSQSSDRVKLPKLVLHPFSGDITFWEFYESAVHNNRDLLSIDRFNII